MLNINLVPEVKREQARVKQLNLAVSAVAFVVGGVVLAAILLLGSLLGYRSTKITATDNNIKNIQNELVAYKDLEESVLTLEKGLSDIKQITEGGRDWTAFYGEIEKAMPADTQFISFKVSGNTVNADVVGKNVSSIDRFIKSFSGYKDKDQQPVYSNVLVNGYNTKDSGEAFFQVSFEVVGGVK